MKHYSLVVSASLQEIGKEAGVLMRLMRITSVTNEPFECSKVDYFTEDYSRHIFVK